jgi:O-antigen ligase
MLLAKTKPDKNIIMDCLCVVSACVVGLLAIQTYIKPEITSWWTLILHGGENGSPIGNMGNQNLASAVVAFCFPAFLRTKPLIIMGSLITALGLIMAKTFGGVLAVSSGVIVWALIRGNQKTVWLLLVGFCGLIYLKYIDQPGSSARLQAWAEGWNITRQHPRFGCGLGNFKTVFPLLDTQWGYLHNDVFQSWFEMGIKTPMLILGFVCSYFWKAESIALIAGVIILVNSLVNFPFHIGTTAMMAITWLGLFNTPIRGGNGNWNCYSHI